MTRKDFVALAADLKVTLSHHIENEEQRKGFNEAYACIIDAMKRANPRFDVEKFNKAVGI